MQEDEAQDSGERPAEQVLSRILVAIGRLEAERDAKASAAASDKRPDRGINWTVLIPAIVTIIVAFIGVMSSMLLEAHRAATESRSEATKAVAEAELAERQREGNLILEAVKTGDQAIALANLKFFIDAGLISDTTGKIAALAQANRAPTLPSLAGPPPTIQDPCSAPLFNPGGSASVDAGGATFTIATCTNTDDMRGEFLLSVTGNGTRPAQVELAWTGSGEKSPLVDSFRAYVQPGTFSSTKKPFPSYTATFASFPFSVQIDGGNPIQVDLSQPVR